VTSSFRNFFLHWFSKRKGALISLSAATR